MQTRVLNHSTKDPCSDSAVINHLIYMEYFTQDVCGETRGKHTTNRKRTKQASRFEHVLWFSVYTSIKRVCSTENIPFSC